MKRTALLACILLVACSQSVPVARNKGVYLLLDTSGTYRAELRKAEDVILYTLSRLEPADSFAVARIDTGSFSEKDIIAKTTFDERPSVANAQKRVFAQKVHDFISRENSAQYTDITGGLLQAVEFLNESQTHPSRPAPPVPESADQFYAALTRFSEEVAYNRMTADSAADAFLAEAQSILG